MKATLIAAAFLIPTLVLGADPQSKDTYGQKEKSSQQQTQESTVTPTQVLTDLHNLSQTGIEQATVAQSNAGSERVKSFAEKQVKDFQKLDRQVLDLAKERKITLTSMGTGSEDYGTPGTTPPPSRSEDEMGKDNTGTGSGTTGSTGTDTRSGATGSGTTGGTGTTTQMGTAGDTRTGTATETPEDQPGSTTEPQKGTTTDTRMGTAGKMDKEAQDSRWQRLKTLKGSEFDAEYLSMVNDNAKEHLAHLESSRIKGDRKIDKLIDTAVKNIKDQQKQVEKLQREIRAS